MSKWLFAINPNNTFSLTENNTRNESTNTSNNIPVNPEDTVPGYGIVPVPNVTEAPYPTNPNHPTNPNYKPHSINNSISNIKRTISNTENRQIGFTGNNSSNNTSNEMRGIISDEVKQSLEPISKWFKKFKEQMEDSNDRGFAKATEKGIEGEELFKNLPKLGKKAIKVLKEPPKTWKKYLEEDEPDYESIYKMETEELKEAMKKVKEEGTKSIDKELTHVMASLLGMMLMECNED